MHHRHLGGIHIMEIFQVVTHHDLAAQVPVIEPSVDRHFARRGTAWMP